MNDHRNGLTSCYSIEDMDYQRKNWNSYICWYALAVRSEVGQYR